MRKQKEQRRAFFDQGSPTVNVSTQGSFPRLNSETDMNTSPTSPTNNSFAPPQHDRTASFDSLDFMATNFDSTSPTSFANPFATSPTTTRSTSPSTMLGQGNNNFEPVVDEVPLLEELGINIKDIFYKSYFVLNPFSKTRRALAAGQVSSSNTQHGYALLAEKDLAGPLLFALTLGLILLFKGKVHFNYIYGHGVLGTLLVFFIIHLMSHKSVSLTHTMTVLGYCLLPMVISAFVSSVAIPLLATIWKSFVISSAVSTTVNALVICWSTWSATQWMATIFDMREQTLLIAYPILLFYSTFALISFF